MPDFVTSMELRVQADQAKAALKATSAEVQGLGQAAVTSSAKAGGLAPAVAGVARATPAVKALQAQITGIGTASEVAAGRMRQIGGASTLAAGSVGNLTAQFNDIGMMMAAGQNPLMLAIQQGTQVSQVIGPMGAAGAVKALDTAFMATINPVSLLNLASSRAGPRWCNGRCGRRGRARIPRRWRIGSRRLVMRPKPGKGRRRQRG